MSFKSISTIVLSTFLSVYVYGQKNDTIISPKQNLDEIVISGQYNPQSINKAINNVTVLNRERIENLGAVTLADALNQVMNISILPNAQTGRSTVKMFGLDAQYFTILIDNVPMISDEGFGNNTDLTQINLDDVERVEIVEGAMGVDYGANAVTGIINIITKKNSLYDWNINAFVQEETVSSEYNLTNQGKHIQGFSLGHNITDKLYTSLSYTHNDFRGYYGGRQGMNYYGEDDKRGHEFLPKNQNNVKALLNYRGSTYKVFYKFEYFNERMKNYAKLFEFNEDPIFETIDPVAKDKILNSNRYSNVLNASGHLNDILAFNIDASYQKQIREADIYRYRIKYDEKFDRNTFKNESKEVWYSRGSFSDFIKWESAKFQLGYDIRDTKGYSSMTEEFSELPKSKRLSSYDFFASSEIQAFPRLMIRPGYRLMTSNVFKSQHALSVVLKYDFGNDYEVRATIGTAPRLPNYDELYTYFVDVNHDLQGNINLKPEKGKTFFLNLKKSLELSNGLTYNGSMTGRYLEVDDKIDVIQIVDNGGLKFKYENVNRYRNVGFTFLNQFSYDNFQLGLGFTMSGIAQRMFDAPKATDKFLYTPEFTANASYKLPKLKTAFSVYYKFNGEETKYKMESDLMGEYYIKGKQESYSWMDISVRQPFLKNKLTATLGIRNLFDVGILKSTLSSGTAHESAASSMPIAYGRSYFLKVQYNFGF